jgi:ABC-type nitrate/sulfonate/bicarbonate transport system substrate-binding protein
MTDKEFQMMNAALPRVRRYGPELTENEQVIVLQGEWIEQLVAALRELTEAAGDTLHSHPADRAALYERWADVGRSRQVLSIETP